MPQIANDFAPLVRKLSYSSFAHHTITQKINHYSFFFWFTGPSRDRVPPRESDINGTESRGSSSPSPSSSPGSHYHQPLKLTSQQQSSARSPDSDDQQQQQHQGPPLQSLKTEVEDGSHRQDEGSKCSEANGAGANSSRCISSIFAAHGKLKRLLGTLVQFAMDISPDTGDTVRTLVLGLLVSYRLR